MESLFHDLKVARVDHTIYTGRTLSRHTCLVILNAYMTPFF